MTREDAIQALKDLRDIRLQGVEWTESLDIAIEVLQTDLVRCKDCRHAYYADNRVPHDRTWVCERFMNEEINANDFCSWGEKREL